MQTPKTYQILTNLNCNLDCTYCYEKKCNKVNTKENIKQYLGCMFEKDQVAGSTVTIEIIGGEPFLYPDLIEYILELGLYLGREYETKIRFSISTNGTLFNKPEITNMLLKYKRCLGIGISIDGTEATHNKHRVYKNTKKGSYSDVVNGVNWLKDNWCPNNWGVKATFTKDTMLFYAEAIKGIYALGCKDIAANLIFEDKADYNVCLDQFLNVADFLLENLDCVVHQFSTDRVSMAGLHQKKDRNYCGTTKFMTCLGFDGYIYGCNRFCTMNKSNMATGRLSGNSIEWYDTPFIQKVINQYDELPKDCKECVLAYLCPMCVAAPYDEGADVKEYYNEKRMCNWTFALSTVLLYMKNKAYHKKLG